MIARMRRWASLAWITIRYLLMNPDERRELLAILRREAWQARLVAAEAARLAEEAARVADGQRQAPNNEETT
jgi:Mg2+/Co2+ transporter CorC